MVKNLLATFSTVPVCPDEDDEKKSIHGPRKKLRIITTLKIAFFTTIVKSGRPPET
jgi:hypothetical protein